MFSKFYQKNVQNCKYDFEIAYKWGYGISENDPLLWLDNILQITFQSGAFDSEHIN